MAKYLTYVSFLALLLVLGGCKKNQTNENQQGEAMDTVVVQETEPVADNRPKADEFKTIKQTICWLTTKKEKELDSYLGCMNEVDLQWPVALAGCNDLSALHHHLLKMLFGKEAPSVLEDALSDYLETPAYEKEFTTLPAKQVSSKQLTDFRRDEGCMSYDKQCGLRMVQTSPTITTFEVTHYEYNGGAHGYGTSEYVLFDRKSGRLYIEANVFLKPQNKKLLSLLNQRIKKMSPSFSPNYSPAEEVPTFYPTSKGLTFVFPPYAIGCYAEGEVEVELTYAALEEELTPDFRELVKAAATFKKVK